MKYLAGNGYKSSTFGAISASSTSREKQIHNI